MATLQSPQFRRTLDVFSAALTSGRLDLRHFGLDPQVCSYILMSILTHPSELRVQGFLGVSQCTA